MNRGDLSARIPWPLVEEALKTTPRRVLLAARDPEHDVVLGDDVTRYVERVIAGSAAVTCRGTP
jgi:trimethylamine:corrinoid methyltransferase-like protein